MRVHTCPYPHAHIKSCVYACIHTYAHAYTHAYACNAHSCEEEDTCEEEEDTHAYACNAHSCVFM